MTVSISMSALARVSILIVSQNHLLGILEDTEHNKEHKKKKNMKIPVLARQPCFLLFLKEPSECGIILLPALVKYYTSLILLDLKLKINTAFILLNCCNLI